jgi:single-strand DNA-binding protein
MSTASINEVRLIGNLGAAPDFRLTDNGTPVATMQIATSYHRGENEYTEWHRIVLWKNLAERAQKYLRKGSPVYIAGRLQTRNYKDKDGIERWVTEVVAENIQLLGPRKPNTGEEGEGATAPAAKSSGKQRIAPPAPAPGPEEDDIPF